MLTRNILYSEHTRQTSSALRKCWTELLYVRLQRLARKRNPIPEQNESKVVSLGNYQTEFAIATFHLPRDTFSRERYSRGEI